MSRAVLAGRDYAPDPPTAYVCSLIAADDEDGLFLAQSIKTIEHTGYLRGSCIETTADGTVGLWVISGKKSHLIYAFFRTNKEIFYLMAFNGDIDKHIPEARRRLRLLQS